MIEVKHLYKRFHNHHGSDWVLRDIDFTIPTGVSVGILGRNGAGKSTLMQLIGGMEEPERGSVVRHSRVSWPIGLNGGFQPKMTGRQNVKFVARVHGGDKDMHRVIKEVQEFAEIGAAFDEPVRTYSSGMRARLAFGLSFAFHFDVYLSDEATAVGDRQFRDKAMKTFKSRVGESSLIMASHQEGILRELCQAGVYLENGRATWFDDIGDAIHAYHEATGGGKKSEPKSQKKGNELAHLQPADETQARDWLAFYEAQWLQARGTLKQAKERGLPPPEIKQRQQAVRAAQKRMDFLESFLAELANERPEEEQKQQPTKQGTTPGHP